MRFQNYPNRNKLTFSAFKSKTANMNTYLNMPDGIGMSASRGYVLLRNGSITGISMQFYASGISGTPTVTLRIKSGADVIAEASTSLASNGTKVLDATFGSGIKPINWGAVLNFYVVISGTITISQCVAWCEVEQVR